MLGAAGAGLAEDGSRECRGAAAAISPTTTWSSAVGTMCGRSSPLTGYARIQWWACICYVTTLAVQVPFLDQLFYVGPLVSSLGGTGISRIVGAGVAPLPGPAGG